MSGTALMERESTAGGVAAQVDGLRVETAAGQAIVEDVSFAVRDGEILAFVGESGSGKTTAVLSLLGHAQAGARIAGGEIEVAGRSLRPSDGAGAQALRGTVVSYVPQNPASALNPSMRVGQIVGEMIRRRGRRATDELVASALAGAKLPSDREFQRRYPHQLSGGQQQRLCIAVSLAGDSRIVVLDEPTTGSDVVTEAAMLAELQRLRTERNLSMVYVSHNLAVVAQLADRLAVMYAGRIIEQGPVSEVLRSPRHPYTVGLLASIPDHLRPRELQPMGGIAVGVGDRPVGCAFAPRCPLRIDACTRSMPELREVARDRRARCLRAEEVVSPAVRAQALVGERRAQTEPTLVVSQLRSEYRQAGRRVVAVDDVSFSVARGECVALVGESGSGKSTIARAIAGLHPAAHGAVVLAGERLDPAVRRRTLAQRRRMQIIFQDATEALNPKHVVRTAIARPIRLLQGLKGRQLDAEVVRLLEQVRLPAGIAARYPAELSGGERQRVAIARALASAPQLIICDEITSALDVSVQAAVLRLLEELKQSLGLGLLFITHDLGVVASLADHVLVLEKGTVCEAGPAATVLRRPVSPYARELLSAAPSISVFADAHGRPAPGADRA
jgi:peptide/nickel transport system ATP-binding protein